MQTQTYNFIYPRRKFVRRILKIIGKMILPIVFKLEFEGLEKFPKKGPVIVVGNHYAIMEAVLIVIYAPYLLEFMGSVDVPHEDFANFFFNLYQVIPVFRGKTEQGSFKKAIEILNKGGEIGIFPEGGHFDPGHMQAQSGVAWMSFKANAPVVPIGISGSMGALTKAFQFKRPTLKMKVGDPIPALQIEDRKQRKTKLKKHAQKIMDQVLNLLSEEELAMLNEIQNEQFFIDFKLYDQNKNIIDLPSQFSMENRDNLVKLLYKKVIMKIYRNNYQLPIDALEMVHTDPTMQEYRSAISLILEHLNDEENGNPYLLTYRFGDQGYKMKKALEELLELTYWCLENNATYQIDMRREYDSLSQNKHIVQIEQERIDLQE